MRRDDVQVTYSLNVLPFLSNYRLRKSILGLHNSFHSANKLCSFQTVEVQYWLSRSHHRGMKVDRYCRRSAGVPRSLPAGRGTQELCIRTQEEVPISCGRSRQASARSTCSLSSLATIMNQTNLAVVGILLSDSRVSDTEMTISQKSVERAIEPYRLFP